MKRHFFAGFKALCISAIALFAAVSCYDDSALNAEIDGLQEQIQNLDERLKKVEELTAKLEALTLRVDALYTLEFSVNDANELLYSFDGGKNWISTGIILVSHDDLHEPTPPCDCVPVDPCDCPPVSLVDNGDSVTITVGEASFTIEKPLEVEFEVKGGRVFFTPNEVKTISLKATAIEEMFVLGTPAGWNASIVNGALEVTAPAENPDYYGWGSPVNGDQSGLIKVAGIATDGRTFVGKASVCAANSGLAVYAYNGNAHFEVSGDFMDAFYYGVCKKDEYEAVVSKALQAAYNWNTDYLASFGYGFETTEVPISHMLGTPEAPVEPEAGVEYVVWAFIDSWDVEYKLEEVVFCNYSLVDVNFEVTEIQAYDVQIELSVEGADSYMAVSIPEDQYMGPDSPWGTSADNMIGQVQYGGVYGVILEEDYIGSIYEICANTQFSATGQAGLGKKCYLLVLPMDGRPMEAYTAEDVYTFETQCSPATKGGNVTMTVEQIYEYDNYGEMKEVNRYNDIYLSVTPSEGWYALYNVIMTDEELNGYLTNEAIIDYILANSYGMFAADEVPGQPITVPFTELGPGQTVNYLAIAVDKNGQYTELYEAQFSTDEIEYSATLTLAATTPETITTNNVSVSVQTEGTATAYRYVCFAEDNSTWRYTYGSDPDAAIMALVTNDYSEWSNPSVNVEAADWTGTVDLTGLDYDKTYYFFVAAWDENGNPAVAQCEFTPEFVIGTPLAAGTDAWKAVQPVVTYSTAQDGNYYDITVNITPVEGTTVSVMVDCPEDYDVDVTNSTSAIKSLFNTLGMYNRSSVTSEGTIFGYRKYTDEDGDGVWSLTYTYKSVEARIVYAVQCADGTYCEPVVIDPFAAAEPASVDNSQWIIPAEYWGEFMAACPAILDLGVTAPGYMMFAEDYETLYGPDAAGIWMQAMAGAGNYTVEVTDETSGTINLETFDHFGEVAVTPIPYSGLTATECTFDLSNMFGTGPVTCTRSTEVIAVTAGGVAM